MATAHLLLRHALSNSAVIRVGNSVTTITAAHPARLR
jgi:hypothetical protein